MVLGNITDTKATIRLPTAAALVGGDLTWEGDLKAGVSQSFSAQIIFKQPGKWMIGAFVGHKEDSPLGNMDTVYVNVGAEQSEFGWTPTPPGLSVARPGDGKIVGPAFDPPDYFENIPPPPSITLDGKIIEPIEEHHSINVTGRFQYWIGNNLASDYRNRDDPNQFTLVPATNFLVEIRGSDNSHRGWGYTDASGHYSISGIDPTGGIKQRCFAYVSYVG